MPMEEGLKRYLVQRALSIIPTFFGVVILIFVISRILPGNIAVEVLGPHATAAQLQQFNARFGLDQPLYVQLFNFFVNLFQGNLGISYQTNSSVIGDLETRFPATLELTTAAMIIATVLGVLIGTVSATSKRRYVDPASRLFSLYGVSLPEWWTGLLLQLGLAFGLGLFPPTGRFDYQSLNPPIHITGLYVVDSVLSLNWPAFTDSLWHLALPAFVLSLGAMAQIARMTRSSLIEQLSKDYVTFQKENGLPDRIIVYKYMLKSGFSSVLTIIGLTYAFLLGGDFLVESVFAWPGMGLYAVQALVFKDYNAIVGVVIVIGLSFIIVNFAVDLLYAYLDPRVRLRRG